MLTFERELEHDDVTDHHLTITLGNDNWIDLVVSIPWGRKVGLTAELLITANIGGDLQSDKSVSVVLSLNEARKLIRKAKQCPVSSPSLA
jgi:hypothetical protein